MTKLVTIFGGSGFVGRHIAKRMAKQGWRVRVAVRNPDAAAFVKPYGAAGQVEPVQADVKNADAIRIALRGADAVVSCASVRVNYPSSTFDDVQNKSTRLIGEIAAEEGVEHLVHVSAIGVDADSDIEYSRTKAIGDASLQEVFPKAIILRPSIMFGPGDDFFNRFAGMAKMGPMLPIFGAETKFQPVYVDDVAAAAEAALTGEATPGIYDLGGPDTLTFRAMMDKMLRVIRRNRTVVNFPFFAGHLMGTAFDILQSASFGLFKNTVLSRDQIKLLAIDNVASEGAMGFADLGITPTALDTILPDYLWTYRPAGQFEPVKDGTRDLKA